ncbi:unnamed protein product [Chrysoparadoxa australica]
MTTCRLPGIGLSKHPPRHSVATCRSLSFDHSKPGDGGPLLLEREREVVQLRARVRALEQSLSQASEGSTTKYLNGDKIEEEPPAPLNDYSKRRSRHETKKKQSPELEPHHSSSASKLSPLPDTPNATKEKRRRKSSLLRSQSKPVLKPLPGPVKSKTPLPQCTNTYAPDSHFFPAFGSVVGETMDKMISDGVVSVAEGKKLRILMAAEHRELHVLVREYERQGMHPGAVQKFRKGLEAVFKEEGLEISPRAQQGATATATSTRATVVHEDQGSSHCTGAALSTEGNMNNNNLVRAWNKLGASLAREVEAVATERQMLARPKALLVGSAGLNPIHRLHLRYFYLARLFLEDRMGMNVIGAALSPSHPTLVRQRLRARPCEIIPPKHRLAMARAAVGESKWLVVDPWEITRRRVMDHMSIMEHAKEALMESFPQHENQSVVQIIFICKPSQIMTLNPNQLRAGGFRILTVCRPLETQRLLDELPQSMLDVLHVVEDTAILSAELERTNSRAVREHMCEGLPLEGMVGGTVAKYILRHHIAAKVSGKERWSQGDKAFHFESEDELDRPYRNLPPTFERRPSQFPLQI